MDALLHDLRYALRQLARNPALSVAAVLTLALGIGGATTMGSFVESIVLRDLPYPRPHELVGVEQVTPSGWEIPSSPANYAAWAAAAPALAEIAAATYQELDLAAADEPRRLPAARVTASFFPLLGAEAARGRTFLPGEDRPGAAPVVVIGEGLWRRELGADPAIVGRSLSLSDRSYQVVGVLPASFRPPEALDLGEVELWTNLGPFIAWSETREHGLAVLGRLAPGVGPEAAREMLATVTAEAAGAGDTPDEPAMDARVVPLERATLGEIGGRLWLLLGAVGLVLLIACANVANLLLARALGRRRESATRAALGAGWGALCRQHLAEASLLALAGGAAGALIAVWAVDLLVALAPAGVPRLAEVSVAPAVLAGSLGLALATGLAFGAAPALAASRTSPARSLRDGGRGGADRRSRRMSHLLVVAEVALALVLVAGAGLLARSLFQLGRVDPGFEARGRTAMRVELSRERYPEAAAQGAFFQSLLERVAALPGVAEAAAVSDLPLSGRTAVTSFEVPGAEVEEGLRAGEHQVTPGYFRTMGIPILAGRGFTAADGPGGEPVVVVNRTLAQRFWPGADPVGRTLVLGATEARVVGVAGDVRHNSLDQRAPLEIYGPAAQIPRHRMEIVVRAAGPVPGLADALRRAVWEIDPRQPVAALRPLPQVVSASLAGERFPALLLGLFAAIALALAAVGLYGVLAYFAGRRRRELGIRVALGARRGEVVGMVLGQAARLAGAGIALGALAALGLTRLLSALLYEVSPTDPATFTAVALLLAAVAALAAYLPARRAGRVDPAATLREE